MGELMQKQIQSVAVAVDENWANAADGNYAYRLILTCKDGLRVAVDVKKADFYIINTEPVVIGSD